MSTISHPDHRDPVPGCVACELRSLDAQPDSFVRVDPDQLKAVREAAAAAATAQRLLDLQHLRSAVIGTEQGPAVLWADIERVMPLPRQ